MAQWSVGIVRKVATLKFGFRNIHHGLKHLDKSEQVVGLVVQEQSLHIEASFTMNSNNNTVSLLLAVATATIPAFLHSFC